MKAEIGVTGPQRLVIRMVAIVPGISPSELARWLHFHKSTVTIILRSLERAKLVKRAKSTIDARSITLRLTPKGTRIARRSRGTVESVVRHVLSQTSSTDASAARRVLEALTEAFE
jgi:DNA-binding MarR family transcriptional regulator